MRYLCVFWLVGFTSSLIRSNTKTAIKQPLGHPRIIFVMLIKCEKTKDTMSCKLLKCEIVKHTLKFKKQSSKKGNNLDQCHSPVLKVKDISMS